MKTAMLMLCLLAPLGCATPGPRPTLGQPNLATADKGKIVIDVTGLRNDKGNINCDLFAGPQGFPVDSSQAFIALNTKISQGHSVCEFNNVPPGVYAVAAMHDENDNNDMDTGFLGIPAEGETASRGAKGFMGPPKYDDAAFEFTGGEVRLTLPIRY